MVEVGESTRLDSLMRQMILVRGISRDDAYLADRKDKEESVPVDDVKSLLFHPLTRRDPTPQQPEDTPME